MASHDDTYQPRDTLANTAKTTLQLTTAGAVVAGVQNTLRKQNVGAMGIITRSGGIIALFGASLETLHPHYFVELIDLQPAWALYINSPRTQPRTYDRRTIATARRSPASWVDLWLAFKVCLSRQPLKYTLILP